MWTIVSDQRLKEVLSSFDLGLPELLQMRPKIFRYNGLGDFGSDVDTTKEYVGLVAQEVPDALMPHCITRVHMRLHPTDAETTEVLLLDTSCLPYLCINSVREQEERLASCEARLGQVEGQMREGLCQSVAPAPPVECKECEEYAIADELHTPLTAESLEPTFTRKRMHQWIEKQGTQQAASQLVNIATAIRNSGRVVMLTVAVLLCAVVVQDGGFHSGKAHFQAAQLNLKLTLDFVLVCLLFCGVKTRVVSHAVVVAFVVHSLFLLYRTWTVPLPFMIEQLRGRAQSPFLAPYHFLQGCLHASMDVSFRVRVATLLAFPQLTVLSLAIVYLRVRADNADLEPLVFTVASTGFSGYYVGTILTLAVVNWVRPCMKVPELLDQAASAIEASACVA